MQTVVPYITQGDNKIPWELSLHIQRPLLAVADLLLPRQSGEALTDISRKSQGVARWLGKTLWKGTGHIEQRSYSVRLCGAGSGYCRKSNRGISQVGWWSMEDAKAGSHHCMLVPSIGEAAARVEVLILRRLNP